MLLSEFHFQYLLEGIKGNFSVKTQSADSPEIFPHDTGKAAK